MRISVIRSKIVDLDNESAEPDDAYGLILRKDYGPGVKWNEDFAVTRLTRDQVVGPTPAELVKFLVEKGQELSDTIEFGAQEAGGVYVGDVLVEPAEIYEILNPAPRP